jgi:hypothetical protein
MRFTVFSSSPRSLGRVARCVALGSGALVTAATLAACQPDTGPGSVVVSYVLGNSKMCDEVGVTDVQASLFKGDYDNPSVLYSEMVSCAEGEVVLESIPPNTYEVRVIGYDDAGVATFDNLGQDSTNRVVEVFEAAQSDIEQDLSARPADLRIRWRLGADGFGNCTGVGIARFEISAYETGGGTLMLQTEIDCEAGGDSQGYRLVPDPDRELNGARFGEVGIQAIAADGTDVGDPAVFEFDPVGAGYPVELAIECTQAGCISA